MKRLLFFICIFSLFLISRGFSQSPWNIEEDELMNYARSIPEYQIKKTDTPHSIEPAILSVYGLRLFAEDSSEKKTEALFWYYVGLYRQIELIHALYPNGSAKEHYDTALPLDFFVRLYREGGDSSDLFILSYDFQQKGIQEEGEGSSHYIFQTTKHAEIMGWLPNLRDYYFSEFLLTDVDRYLTILTEVDHYMQAHPLNFQSFLTTAQMPSKEEQLYIRQFVRNELLHKLIQSIENDREKIQEVIDKGDITPLFLPPREKNAEGIYRRIFVSKSNELRKKAGT